jgi:hypothetical protein
MSNSFRCISQSYDEPGVIETRRTVREVAAQDARLLRGITRRAAWVEDAEGNVVVGRRPSFMQEDEGVPDYPLDAR